MYFLLNLSHCIRSYGHFVKFWLLLRCLLTKYGHVTWPKLQISKILNGVGNVMWHIRAWHMRACDIRGHCFSYLIWIWHMQAMWHIGAVWHIRAMWHIGAVWHVRAVWYIRAVWHMRAMWHNWPNLTNQKITGEFLTGQKRAPRFFDEILGVWAKLFAPENFPQGRSFGVAQCRSQNSFARVNFHLVSVIPFISKIQAKYIFLGEFY